MFGGARSMFFFFSERECIKLIKSGSIDIYNVTKLLKKSITVSTHKFFSFNIDNNKKR